MQPHYSRTLNVKASPQEAYAALTEGFEAWWTRPDTVIRQPGDRISFTFPPGQSFWTFEAVILEPARRVELVCVGARHLHEGQPSAIETEWLDTRLRWTLTGGDEGCVIAFEHEGLRPELLCWDVCEAGWNHFFVSSLQAYLDTGTGHPHRLVSS